MLILELLHARALDTKVTIGEKDDRIVAVMIALTFR